MENEPIRDPRIIEALEACRPGGDDLADPDLALLASQLADHPELDEVYERLQRLDEATAKAFQEVPVPEGLASRILDRLALAEARETVPAQAAEMPSAEPPSPAETVATAALPRPRASRRRWLLASASLGLGLAASLLVAVMLRSDGKVYTDAEVVTAAMQFFEDERPAQAGDLVLQKSPPGDYPLSPLVVRHSRVRWRWASGFLGQDAVAYDLTRPGGPRATLYVVKQTVADVPPVPPSRPALSTHNRSVSAWQSGGLLYVLVVDGGPRTYRSYLDLPSGPVA